MTTRSSEKSTVTANGLPHNQRRSRILLVALGLLFALPILISALLAFSGFRISDVSYFKPNNYGQLVVDEVKLQPFSLPVAYLPPTEESEVIAGAMQLDLAQQQRLTLKANQPPLEQGEKPPADEFGALWTLITVVGSNCGLDCKTRLNHVRSMTGQRKTLDLVTRLTLVLGEPTPDFINWLQLEHKDAPVAFIDVDAASKNYPATAANNASGLLQPLQTINQYETNSIYLVSPRQQVGFYWSPEQADTKKMLKEIEHLLKFMRGG